MSAGRRGLDDPVGPEPVPEARHGDGSFVVRHHTQAAAPGGAADPARPGGNTPAASIGQHVHRPQRAPLVLGRVVSDCSRDSPPRSGPDGRARPFHPSDLTGDSHRDWDLLDDALEQRAIERVALERQPTCVRANEDPQVHARWIDVEPDHLSISICRRGPTSAEVQRPTHRKPSEEVRNNRVQCARRGASGIGRGPSLDGAVALCAIVMWTT